MKKILLTFLGLGAFIFMLALNFKHAMNDYGIVDSKLHIEVLAQSNSSGGGNTTGGGSSGGSSSGGSSSGSSKGPKQTTRVHCTGSTTTTITLYEDGITSNGWQLSGGINGNWSVIGANFGGQYNQQQGGSTGATSNIVKISNWDFWADMIYCQEQNGECNNFNPCKII